MRTRDVTGAGIAFIAIYQHDATGTLVEHRDFASTRGATPGQFYTHEFTPKPQVARLHVMMVSGFVFEQPAVLQSGPQLRFRDNYFTLNGRPTFLFGSDLRSAQAILIAPFEPGRAELPRRPEPLVATIGEFCKGRWRTLEQIALDPARPTLEIDSDRATCLILVCPPAQSQRWINRLTQAMLRPDQIAGDGVE